MDIEKIKKVKLLVTLKGTDSEGKQIKWLAGTVFDKAKRPFPLNIIKELQNPRIPSIFEMIEVYEEPKVVPRKEEQETPTKEAPSKSKTRIKLRRK